MNYKSNPKIIEKNHTFDNIFQYTKIPTVQISLNKQDMDNIRNLIIKTIINNLFIIIIYCIFKFIWQWITVNDYLPENYSSLGKGMSNGINMIKILGFNVIEDIISMFGHIIIAYMLSHSIKKNIVRYIATRNIVDVQSKSINIFNNINIMANHLSKVISILLDIIVYAGIIIYALIIFVNSYRKEQSKKLTNKEILYKILFVLLILITLIFLIFVGKIFSFIKRIIKQKEKTIIREQYLHQLIFNYKDIKMSEYTDKNLNEIYEESFTYNAVKTMNILTKVVGELCSLTFGYLIVFLFAKLFGLVNQSQLYNNIKEFKDKDEILRGIELFYNNKSTNIKKEIERIWDNENINNLVNIHKYINEYEVEQDNKTLQLLTSALQLCYSIWTSWRDLSGEINEVKGSMVHLSLNQDMGKNIKDINNINLDIILNPKPKTYFRINHNFQKGNMYVIDGESGSGKTTTINIMIGLYKNYQGKVLFNDTDIKDILLSSLYKNISIVLQDCVTLIGSVSYNISFDKPIDEEIINRLNLHKIINNPVKSLSGGERQRVVIARAIYKLLYSKEKINIFILDEPLSALDHKNAMIISEYLLEICKKKNIIMICVDHTGILSKLSDKIITIDPYTPVINKVKK